MKKQWKTVTNTIEAFCRSDSKEINFIKDGSRLVMGYQDGPIVGLARSFVINNFFFLFII